MTAFIEVKPIKQNNDVTNQLKTNHEVIDLKIKTNYDVIGRIKTEFDVTYQIKTK